MSDTQILIYQSRDGKVSVDTIIEDETVWLTTEQMATLFGKAKSTVNEHILNIFEENELIKEEVMRKNGNSDYSTKPTNFYNLDVIISVGYRVKSQQGTQFRIWATQRLKEYLLQGFSLNEEKLKSGKSTQYFDKLQEKLREIRLSERLFYQKIKDIYTTSIDYNPKDDKTITFFKTVQNKLLWAISKKTAAELVHSRTNSDLPFIGMQSCDKKTEKQIIKKDVSVAKNYLKKEEIKILGLLVEQYLAFAESMAQSRTPMKMVDWIEQLNIILQMNKKEILTHYGKITHELAVKKSEKEYQQFKEKQRIIERTESIKELEKDIKKLGK